MPAVIGVTGPIAVGKTTVDGMLRDLGADPVIDADHVVHDLYAFDKDVQETITSLFGPGVRLADGAIDRRALSERVFGDSDALRRLEDSVHPVVRRIVRERLRGAQAVAVIDAVKLLQGDLADECTVRWWVQARPDIQRRRLVEGRGMTPQAADQRLAAQLRLEEWRDRIDRVIDNSGSLAATRYQVEEGWRALVVGRITAE